MPRSLPEAFWSFPVTTDVPIWTEEMLSAANGENGTPLCFALNGKIVEYIGPRDHNSAKPLARCNGQHFDFVFAKICFDPKYGAPDRLEDLSREQAAYLEDMVKTLFDFNELCRVVALIPQRFRDT
jgi:hypothetical protein